jgi:23S rRNA pseudouridine2605 synthase
LKPEAPNPLEQSEKVRLQVYLAHAGVASRRASEKLIAAGRVSVNGQPVTTPGEKVSPEDTVCVDNIRVMEETILHYLALNKPPGFLCSSGDSEGRPLAKDLLPLEIGERLYNIGRLDFLSSGLILFTNDGSFAAITGHPRQMIEKEYLVEATGFIPDALFDRFREGIMIENETYRCSRIERLDGKSLKIVLIEGKNREIRRVFSYFHLHLRRLTRIRIGPVLLGTLGEGDSRALTKNELEKLRKKEGKLW